MMSLVQAQQGEPKRKTRLARVFLFGSSLYRDRNTERFLRTEKAALALENLSPNAKRLGTSVQQGEPRKKTVFERSFFYPIRRIGM
jgi:hypothetical protein